MSGTVVDKDNGWARAVGTAARAGARTIKVGAVGPKAEAEHRDAEALTVAQVLAVHEFGLGVPERSWLRGWIDADREWVREQLRWAARQMLDGMTEEQALEILGARFAGKIQERISDGIMPPLAQSTIDRKGSSKPLIDTGQARAAISWQVE